MCDERRRDIRAPLDSVELWLTFTVEHEYIQRAINKGPNPELAQRNIDIMPDSAAAFRLKVVESARNFLRIALDMAVKPADWHGYTLHEDALPEIHAAFDEVVEALSRAAVDFDTRRHDEIASG